MGTRLFTCFAVVVVVVTAASSVEKITLCRFRGVNNEPIKGVVVKYSSDTAPHETWNAKLDRFSAEYVSLCDYNYTDPSDVFDVDQLERVTIPDFIKQNYNGRVWAFCDSQHVTGVFFPSSNVINTALFHGPGRIISAPVSFDETLVDGHCKPSSATAMATYDEPDTKLEYKCIGKKSMGGRYKPGESVIPNESTDPCTVETCSESGLMEKKTLVCPPTPCEHTKLLLGGCCPVCVLEAGQNNCGRHACSRHAECTNEDLLGFSCTCKPGFKGDGFQCADVDECATGNVSCDNATTHCVNLRGSFECQCYEGMVRVSPTECEKPRVEYKLLDASRVVCCSHVSDHGAVVLKVWYRPDGSVDRAEKVACLHPTKSPLVHWNEYSRPMEITSDEIESIVVTYADYIQRQSPDVNIHSKLKYGKCYRTIRFYEGDRMKKKEQNVYFIAEKLYMFRMVTNRYTSVENRCDILPKYPTEYVKYAVPTLASPKSLGPCAKSGTTTLHPSHFIITTTVLIYLIRGTLTK